MTLETQMFERRRVRSAFVLGAYLRLSNDFLMSAPVRRPGQTHDDAVSAVRTYCMGESIDNMAADAHWKALVFAAAREAVSEHGIRPKPGHVLCRSAASTDTVAEACGELEA